jgi:hypothetical protein
MKALVVTLTVGFVVVGSSLSASAINCEQVRKYLKTGRSAEDIAETMIVDVDEVKKCAAEPAKDPTAAAAEKK